MAEMDIKASTQHTIQPFQKDPRERHAEGIITLNEMNGTIRISKFRNERAMWQP